jgi:hypothetical protein
LNSWVYGRKYFSIKILFIEKISICKMVKKTSKKQVKINKQASLAKAREARIQKEIPRKVFTNDTSISYNRAAQVFLQGVIDILLKRIIALQTNDQPTDPCNAAIACHHVTSIGSSQLHKIAQQCFDIGSLHNRVYYIGARSDGAKWEDVWSLEDCFCVGNECYKILRSFKEPNRYSNKLPWITATPDFIVELKGKDGKPFIALIEIKSYLNKPAMSRYRKQLQVAMDCFNIDIGFLVVYDGNNTIDQKPFIQKLESSHYLEKNKISLHKKYCGFLQKCCDYLFAANVTSESIEDILKKLTEIEIIDFPLEWQNLNIGFRRSACYNNKANRRLGKHKKGKKKIIRHTGYMHNLSIEEKVYVHVDENGDEL